MALAPDRTTIYELAAIAQDRTAAPFDPTTSPLHGRMVFVVGAPRSGTTWLHQLLAVHPDIATAGESHLFCEGLQALYDNHAKADTTMGLRTWVAPDELDTAARRFADDVFDTMRRGARPDAARILDKTPNHRMQSALQARLYPDATYVHIVRDGRDSAASTHAMWKRFSGEYGSRQQTVQLWADAVVDVRTHLGGLRYLEVRYEDLLADPETGLAAILDHIGLAHDPELVTAAVEFGRSPINVAPSSASVGARKRAGDAVVDRIVARTAGDLMIDLGYLSAADIEAVLALRTPATVRADAQATAQRLVGAVPTRVRDTNEWYRRRRWRKDTAAVRTLARSLGEALQSGDGARIRATLGDGGPLAATVDEVVTTMAGGSVVSSKFEPHTAALAVVRPDGERQLLRLAERGGRVAELEVL